MNNDLNIILGGVVVEASLRDGSKEEVKVRQLPIELIGEWAGLQGDEPSLVELYCDRQDKRTPQQLRTLRVQELRLLELIDKADPEKFDEIEARLTALRERIITLEAAERWDAQLIPDSHNEILRIGEELNRPIFDRWTTDRVSAVGQTRTASEKLKALSPSAN